MVRESLANSKKLAKQIERFKSRIKSTGVGCPSEGKKNTTVQRHHPLQTRS